MDKDILEEEINNFSNEAIDDPYKAAGIKK